MESMVMKNSRKSFSVAVAHSTVESLKSKVECHGRDRNSIRSCRGEYVSSACHKARPGWGENNGVRAFERSWKGV